MANKRRQLHKHRRKCNKTDIKKIEKKDIGKYDSELMKYGKASGAFEYAVNRYATNSANQQFKQEVASIFNHLENEAYKTIVDAYRIILMMRMQLVLTR